MQRTAFVRRSLALLPFALAVMVVARIGFHSAPAAAPVQTLTWTSSDVSSPGGTWDSYTATAAGWVEGGYDDWRLPTEAEARAAIAGGTFGTIAPNVNGWRLWTSRSQGIWAWTYQVYSNSNGVVDPVLSGATKKVLRASNLRAKFVRP
jgi:hypothetical protein